MTCSLIAPVCAKTTTGGGSQPAATNDQAPTRLGRLAQKMFPQQKVDELMGFFAPVVKKYLPTFRKFQNEYATTSGKLAVVEKYLPDAQSALAEAKNMRIPAKYEQKKAEYIRLLDGFMAVLKVSTALGR